MNNARNFIKKLAIIILALILADQLIGRWFTYAFPRITYRETGHMNYSIDSTTAPMLILGSSRALHNYVASILTDSLHLECYNAGQEYQNLLYPLAILTAAFQRYHPRTLLLDLKPDAFANAQTDIISIAALLPYYHTHPAFQPILDKRSRWERWKTLSLLYCYRSQGPQIMTHSITDTKNDSISHGYVPLFESVSAPPNNDFPDYNLSCPPDTTLVTAFQNFISLAKQNHCHLVVVISPVYYPLQHGSSSISAAAEICHTQHITFLDYSNAPGYAKQNSLYIDGTHFNDSGARKFTRLLAASLHNYE